MNYKESKLYTNHNLGELLGRLNLYNQAFDYNLGLYNEDLECVDPSSEIRKDIKLKYLVYTTWHRMYIDTYHTDVVYLPFFIYLRDKKIDLDIGDYSYDK